MNEQKTKKRTGISSYNKHKERAKLLEKQLHELKLQAYHALQNPHTAEAKHFKADMYLYRVLTLEFKMKDVELWKAIPDRTDLTAIENFMTR